jgi:hypothetical protein
VRYSILTAILLAGCLNDRTLPTQSDGLDYGSCVNQPAAYVQRFGEPAGKKQLEKGIVLWVYYPQHREDFTITFDGHQLMECDITYQETR